MDITYIGDAQFRLKVKTGGVVTKGGTVAITHKSTDLPDFSITAPGEYEVEGISVFGYQTEKETIYVVQAEDLRILYLGEITKQLSEKLITELENIDVVMLNVDTLGAKEATDMIAQLEPYYVLPYGESTEKFIAAYEHSSRSVKNLVISKVSLPEDLTEVIVFEH